ncbi:MAG: matrixin family metalloprotease [Planctomycetes bacterium]|nr:matrixin family metalloprotease [Planctomycetota bacterium]
MIQHDIQASRGTSGSALFDERGDVVAVHNAATIDETASNRFAIRVDLVRELLSDIGLGRIAAIDPSQPPTPNVAGEPNDTFAQADVVSFDSGGVARLEGTVESLADLDVFLLGALSAGDRILVDADTTGSNLDVSVALFDDQQRLVYANDDRTTSFRFLDSYLDWIVRHTSSAYYLVVTGSGFATAGTETGDYEVAVEVTSGFAVPEPTGQILLLDFDGAVIDTPGLGSIVLDSFDAADIDSVYRGETQVIKDAIRSFMAADFAAFDITIVTTDDPPLPAGTEFSSVFFGGRNVNAFGLSESVDLYNVDFCDDAVIFTESFSPALFSQIPTAAELSVAIANVASHEAGHILGLNHVTDDLALMDDQSTTDALLVDQRFQQAPLSPDVMSIGTQDSVLLLLETVGPQLDAVYKYVADRLADAWKPSVGR